ncbi:dynamin family protein [Dichotomicrobium thermohalophilum]|uniref:Dynamin family protein n=1 Tax=Dichotomicrobium thermohalophilum TaxID=933063 RepID=A0A397Q519_9HYPH|nr:dynamin family protein [Dichotomicrobium thermohalophilum]RIA56560.1 dynamin family protein [Dichotomicrobium thermohalophilum]
MTADTTPTDPTSESGTHHSEIGPGSVLQRMVDELQDCASALGADLEGPLAAMAQSLVGELREQVCRVAVIGQVKAGKSSFINALAGRPTMLPTDVNPWTAVVTKIHFGEPGAQEGAYFEFFTEEEWRHMIGGGRMREMATSLAPNLDSEEIHKQLSQFEQRAKRRLGDSFPQMLGKHHLFSSVTPGVLERYVTAGEDRPVTDSAIDESNAHFADITKSADLYFQDNPFGFPTVVIDTPGTNDPFLVRDEITLQNLETADVYIVVVTAQQPLSNTDLNLLRLLQGVDAGRALIFLNRLDMLENAAENYQTVLERVRTILRKEFSTDDIPVIPGSAAWGLRSVTPTGAHRDGTLDDAFMDYAASRGFAERETLRQVAETEQAAESELAKLLTDVSGLSEINAELARLMARSRAAQRIASVAGIVSALTHNYALLSRHEAERIEARAKQDEAQRREDRKQRKAAFETAAKELAERFRTFERDYAALAAEGTRKISDRLNAAVTRLADAEQSALEDKLRAGEKLDAPRLDTIGIRHKLAREFIAAFDEVASAMQAFERDNLKEIDEMFSGSAPGLDGAMTAGPLPAPAARPSLSPLAQAIAVDLDEPRRFVWQSQSDDPRQAVKALRTGLERDFLTVARELSELAKKALSSHAASVTRRYRTIVHETLEIVAKLVQGGASADEANAALEEAQARAERMAALAERAAALDERCREALRSS